MANWDLEKVSRLKQAIRQCDEDMSPFRDFRLTLIKEYVGSHPFPDAANDKRPVNLVEQMLSVYVRSLVAKRPRAMCRTPHRALKPTAASFEKALNITLEKCGLQDSLHIGVMEAMFLIGCFKTGIYAKDYVDVDGQRMARWEVYCDAIGADDLVFDSFASNWKDVAFVGHRYDIIEDVALDSGLFDNTIIEHMMSTTGMQNRLQNKAGSERAESMWQSTANTKSYKRRLRLVDLYLPFDGPKGLVVTICEEGSHDALRVQDYDGPPNGPYKLLQFGRVPQSILPTGGLNAIYDLHTLSNRLFVKLGRQAERQKSWVAVPPGREEAGKQTVKVNDGETISFDAPDKIKEISLGGIHEPNLAFWTVVKNEGSKAGGNLDALAGLAPMSDTVGQDKIIAENATKRLADFADETINVVNDVVKDIAWYLWEDPISEIPIVKTVAGVDVPTVWTPDIRQGEFMQYNITIDPYSMQHQTPATKLAFLTNTLQQIIMPLLPEMKEQGMTIDCREVIQEVMKLGDAEDLLSIISAPDAPVLPSTDVVNKPVATTRKYVRENRASAPTQAGADKVLQQALLGNASQPKERRALMRDMQ